MRLVKQDPAAGLLRVRLETASDLWRIARLVHPGDRVGASTTRRDPEAPEEVPGAQRSRRRIFLTVRAEQVEFHGFSKRVRVTGPIVEGPFDIGRHHTLDLGEGDDVSVTKESLSAADRALLEEGLARTGDPVLLVAAVDWGDSSIVRLRGRAVEPVADIRRTLAGQRFEPATAEKDRTSYLEEVRDVLARELPGATAVVLAGPGFFKEALLRRLTETSPGLARLVRVYPASESGRVGVDEVLRSGRASEVLRASVAAEEAESVERLVRAVASGTRAAVGRREVGEAIDAGAVETLLVSDSVVRDLAIERMMHDAEGARGTVVLVSPHHEAGAKLEGLGGVAALLRFPIR